MSDRADTVAAAEASRTPTRIMRAQPTVYHWRRRLGDTMTESGFSATPVSGGECTPYFRRDAVRQVMVDVCAGSVPQETIDLCRAQGVDPHDALQMGWAAACFKLKALCDALDDEEN